MPVRPPLVSSVMPTRNRPAFAAQAIRYFERQTYPERELVVVDDGDEPVESLCAGRPGVRYLRLRRRTLLGRKLNLGIQQARGRFIHKMDDDDYYAPTFLATALRTLRRREPDRRIAAWDSFAVLIAGERKPRYSGEGWEAGGTLCFAKSLWKKHPFRELPRGVDRAFLDDHDHAVARVRAPELYMLVRHGSNTWNRMGFWETDDWMRERPRFPKSLSMLMSAEDARFYRSLRYAR